MDNERESRESELLTCPDDDDDEVVSCGYHFSCGSECKNNLYDSINFIVKAD